MFDNIDGILYISEFCFNDYPCEHPAYFVDINGTEFKLGRISGEKIFKMIENGVKVRYMFKENDLEYKNIYAHFLQYKEHEEIWRQSC